MNARVDPNDAIIELAASCRFDPLRWSRVAWDWGVGNLEKHQGPREWQDDINKVIRDHLANPATRYQPLQISVASGHGIGKSAEMGMLSNWAMSCWADARITATANTEGQLRTKTAPEIGKWFRTSLTSHWFDVQATSIKSRDPQHGESWRQDFTPWSEHNTEAFAGLHNEGKIILLLFDEASKIHDKVWEVAEGALTDEDTVIIWIVFGNPTRNSGRFRECFRRFRHRWVQRQIDSRTVPGTNKAYLQRLVDDNGEDSDIVKVRVRGQFPAQSAMQFISETDADKARNVHLRKEQYSFAPVIIGVDPAWTGDDKLEIMLRQGLYSKSLATIARNDNDVEVANLIARLEDEHQADAVFVDAGYGTGIVSAGQVMGRSWRLIWFSGKSVDPGYLNQRAYMWGMKKKWLKAGGAIDPRDEELYQDIIGPETVPRLDGKIQLESKEDMKERGMPSPNKGDALALTFAEPVAKKDRTILGGGKQNQAAVDYDPFQ
ncbi:terminase [Mesorhizobium waimense]|uniref:Terminase n=1 Tax=Mesorhizobium waimense TaxID=1300307 RepID=A0A3A5L335_9HYPH|nr:terminase [Mesorhizobium waimense]RJT41997.1 terminase [Mesorhizobium waimense]